MTEARAHLVEVTGAATDPARTALRAATPRRVHHRSGRPRHLQRTTTTDAARAIVGVSVTHRGSDQGQASPVLEPI